MSPRRTVTSQTACSGR